MDLNSKVEENLAVNVQEESMSVAIVGGGNSAHILANLLPRNGIETTLITRKPNEWRAKGITMIMDDIQYPGKELTVSDDFKQINTADVIFLCCPVHVQPKLLSKMKPYTKPTTLIGTVFGQARFDKMVKYIFGDDQPCFAFIQIPWTCRTQKYGHIVENAGEQDTDLAFRNEKDALYLTKSSLRWLDCIYTDKSKKITRCTFEKEWFFPSNNILHPAICYGRYLIQSQNKYFYRDLAYNKMAGAIIEQLDAERLKVIRKLNDRPHCLDINTISIVEQWRDVWKLPGENMCECILSDKALENIVVDKNIHCDKNHRFFRDDIPFGLCFIKHYALILEVETPFLDRVIKWAQSVMDTEYLDEDGRLIKRNLPQYYVNDVDIA